MAAVELPRAWPRARPRRRRGTGLAGILLFACMFLPGIQGCHGPVSPLDMPAVLPPYLYGAVFAILALSASPRRWAVASVALRALSVLIIGSGAVALPVAPPLGAIGVVLGLGFAALVGFGRVSELRVVASGLAAGAVSIAWFGFWSLTPDALIGVHGALAASTCLCSGCLVWLREIVGQPAMALPRAMASARR